MTPAEALEIAHRLYRRLQSAQPDIERADLYYRGRQPLSFLAPEVRREVGSRLTALAINWPRVIVDSVVRRSYAEGFRLGTAGEADNELRTIAQKNDLDVWLQMGLTDSCVHGRSFLSVGPNDEDPSAPKIMVESARQVVVEHSPGTRRVRYALKVWADDDRTYATLYEPTGRWRFFSQRANVVLGDLPSDPAWLGQWEMVPGDEFTASTLGVVPIVPLPNKPRVLHLDGESELTDVMPIADAINKLATDMMVTSEFHATKRRWATGIQIPNDPGQRERLKAEVRQEWDEALKGKTWLAGSGVSFGEFTEASLSNFVEGIKLLTSQVAAIGGLPPDDLGLATTNPASAEARRAADTIRVERAEEHHRYWGGGLERAMQIAVCTRDGIAYRDLPEQYRLMETIWRDPQTPAISQTMDAAVKGKESGVYDVVLAQEQVGLTPTQQAAFAAREEERAAAALTADVRAKVALARELQQQDGLSQNAAFAAVGLLQAAALNAQQ